jgi:FKBP-type peptidyl-prolyl cis-trans isomerase
MNTITTLLSLAVLTASLAGCHSTSDGSAHDSAAGSAHTDSAAMSQWSAGDTIPAGRAGVPDIQILEVHGNGTGEVCGTGRRATLAYKAMLIDGQVIDPGTRPFTFRVGAGEAIQGWDVIVAKMRVGDSFTLVIPQQLAYGPSRGDLKFDMELLSFE